MALTARPSTCTLRTNPLSYEMGSEPINDQDITISSYSKSHDGTLVTAKNRSMTM